MKRLMWLMFSLLFAGYGPLAAQDLTGDQILARAAEEGALIAEGSRINLVDFQVQSADGATVQRSFAFFSKRQADQPDRLLIYFLAPELERGTMFLSVDPVDPAEGARLWLYLSALGQVKELISDQDRSAGFAGSNLQNDQIGGGFDFSQDYVGQLLGQEPVSVTWLGQPQPRTAYKVALEAKPEADVDFPSGAVWVDVETFVVLKGELVNKAGALEQVSTLDGFVEFEGNFEPSTIVVKNLLDESQTTITITDRRTVADLPDEIFTPDALPSFDPAQFGVE